jgi:subtilisin family serine protease
MAKKWFSSLWLMVFALLCLVGSSGALAASKGKPTYQHLEGKQSKYLQGEILVKFKEPPALSPGVADNQRYSSLKGVRAQEFAAALPEKARAALQKVQGQVVRVHPALGLAKVKIPKNISEGEAIEHLYHSGAVEYAEPNFKVRPQAIAPPNDPKFGDQWALNNTGQLGGTAGADIDALNGWVIIKDSATTNTTYVAVVDTGVDYNHPDLALNMWKNPKETLNGIDDDENGWIDDLYGIDTTVDSGPDGVPTPAEGDPMDTNGHGTAVAGVIGAVGNNLLGVCGVNWKAKIMALKFMTSLSNDGTASKYGGDIEAAITCINYALQTKAAYAYRRMVIVLAWKADGYSMGLRDAIRLAQYAGVLVVAAAGNDDEDNDVFPVYPSYYNLRNHGTNNLVSVGASDRNDLKAVFPASYGTPPASNYGCTSVDLFAPGKDILTTVIKGSAPDYTNAYSLYSGTSMAAAHVAGVAALLWSKNPTANFKQIKGLILNGAEDGAGNNDFRPICVTWGRLNLYKSLTAGLIDDPALFEVYPAKANVGDTVTITGINFGASSTGNTLSWLYNPAFTISAANITSWTATKIVFTVPATMPKGTGRLQVTTAAGKSRGACFSHVSPETLIPGQPLILERGFAAHARSGNDVFVIGGYTSYGLTALVEKYSLNTQTCINDCRWMMPTPVSNAAAATIGTGAAARIYVVGGMDGTGTIVDKVQIFNPSATAAPYWTTGTILPQPLIQAAAVGVGTKVYVFGGLNSTGYFSNAVNTTYVYDTVAKTWSTKAPMPVAAAYAAATQNGSGKIWVMGGFASPSEGTEQRVVQEYVLPTTAVPAGGWNIKPHLLRPRAGAGGINNGTKVFCLHGTKSTYSGVDKYADGEYFNPLVGYWSPSMVMVPYLPYTPRPLGLYTPGVGLYSGKIFVLGGVVKRSSTFAAGDYSHMVWFFTSP